MGSQIANFFEALGLEGSVAMQIHNHVLQLVRSNL